MNDRVLKLSNFHAFIIYLMCKLALDHTTHDSSAMLSRMTHF